MRTLIRFFVRLFFGFRRPDPALLNAPGPLILLPNHLSWFDWLFVSACIDDDWKIVTSLETSRISWIHRKLMVSRFTFPVETDSPYAVKRMAEYLKTGGKLVLFPEGRLSRTGSLMKLFDGTGFLLFKTNAKVITCYFRGNQWLPFSPNPNRKLLFPRVSAHFSPILTPPVLANISTTLARRKLTRWLYDTMVKQHFEVEFAETPKNLLDSIIQTARRSPCAAALQDISRTTLSYRRLLAGVDGIAGQWPALLSANENARVGVMLPNANATPVALLSLWAIGKVPAIFNYSTGVPTMLACARLAGIKQVITSKVFLERAKLNLQPMIDAGLEFIFLEDVRDKISGAQKFGSLMRASFAPQSIHRDGAQQETAVILFTSGSEGPPKGVELTHANVSANIHQLLSVLDLMESDRVFNAMPLFHSFGMMGLLLPMVRGAFVFLHVSPLHYRVIPSLLYTLDCTVFFGTNTFLNGYARKANPYDFRSVRMLIGGAEKIQEATANTWARNFGIRVLEGYGATECSPVVTINSGINPRFGSAGQFLPAVEYKFEPVEGVADGGRLWVRGPNIMRGYLNPEANAHFLESGGWYDTGDIGKVDDDGYLYILGRLKRFAKVSGEMVSLTAAEEALAGAFPQYGQRLQIAVLARPDSDRGEVLVAVANEAKVTLDEIRAAIKAKGLSNLYVPRELKYLRDIPKLGTGKVNHRELQKLVT